MSRSENDRLGDIIRAGRKLAEIADYGREDYDGDWTLQDSAVHHVGTIVDAYTNLSPKTQQKFGDMSVREMKAMRARLVHAYWGTNFNVVWNTITEDIPPMVEVAASEYHPPDDMPTVFDEDVSIKPRRPKNRIGQSSSANGLEIDTSTLSPSFGSEDAQGDKRAEAIRLRRAGHTHKEIGSALGMSKSWAQQAAKGVPRGRS